MSEPRYMPTDEVKLFVNPEGENGEVRHTPETFKMSRNILRQAPKVEANLFSALTSPDEVVVEGITITSQLPKSVTEYDLCAYLQAAQQILSNQSYTARHEDTHSGIAKQEAKMGGYTGNILVTLNDLCKLAYGVDVVENTHRRKMAALVEQVDKHKVQILFPNGDSIEVKLIANMATFKTKETGAVGYNLVLNPIFCGENVLKSFGEFPQDVTKRMRIAAKTIAERKNAKRGIKLTARHLRLVQLLGMANFKAKEPYYSIALDNLLNHLGLLQIFKKYKARAMEQLQEAIEIAKEIGLIRTDLTKNPEESYKADGATIYTFHLNSDWKKSSPITSPDNLLPE